MRKTLENILKAPEFWFAVSIGSLFFAMLYWYAVDIREAKSLARAYYYKSMLLQQEHDIVVQPYEDAKIIKRLDIENQDQLRNDLMNLKDNYLK